MSFRIGLGYDVHSFDPDRELILGGIIIPGVDGLKGHSDADALLHAITDALLGALSLGDIGTHFPDNDPSFKNINSGKLLQKSYSLIRSSNYELVNADVTVVAEKPRLNPFIDKIRKNIAGLLECTIGQISIKATTSEKMGFIGRSEGIAVHAVVLIKKS